MKELEKLIPDFKKFLAELPKTIKTFKIETEKDRLSLKSVKSNYHEWCIFIDEKIGEENIELAEIHMNKLVKKDWGENCFMLFDRNLKKAYAVNKSAGYMMHMDTLEIEEL